MGNKLSRFCCCCAQPNSPKIVRRKKITSESREVLDVNRLFRDEQSTTNLQHISEREPEYDCDPSSHPTLGPLFMQRSKSNRDKRRSQISLLESRPLKKVSSCSTIFLDDSTVSQPNLTNTIICVTLAIYYHIKNRKSNNVVDIFNEKMHPITYNSTPTEIVEPDHRTIYRSVGKLFNAAQLSPEYAIITLVYLERLLACAEVDIVPCTWRRIILGAILLASKVWDDQAVWNLDFCQILKGVSIEDMNELERQFLEYIQFNINVSSSVYAKYYFDLRTLAEENDIHFMYEPLSKERAQQLEAMSRLYEDRTLEMHQNGLRRYSSVDSVSNRRRSRAILS